MKYALFDAQNRQTTKAHPHKETVITEAKELGFVAWTRKGMFLPAGWEIREVKDE